MARVFIIFIMSLFLITAGCSKNQVKRTAYETLQNVRQQECSRELSVDCEKRERMEVYEDKREEVLR